ncbi:MAG: Hsp20/alpha crystallin family protein [Syntrophales bacterium]|nr:Hsp20/alpha crystallin family protein [Syntrophales bacterium]MDD5231791.1 Hsp20/alpha crystallin family protein [Syntrophales bacterium]MDD5531228.1 Hsp20/alpha crystallin family protein [Syntrophales bacterium]HPL63887.1 Hsp20/alpha crystallin family protein [Syntrophales bacterium]
MDIERKDVQAQKTEAPVDAERTRHKRVYLPNVDIVEKKDAIIVFADMPGVDEKSVNITLEKNVLTIGGSVEVEHYKGYDLSFAEYGIGDYERAFTVSEAIDREKIEASVSNGVLKLVLPKTEPMKPKKIEVRAS